MFFKKKLTEMQVGLLDYGYTKNEKYNYVEKKLKIGTCDVQTPGLFATAMSTRKETLIIYWNWGEKNLEEKHHDEVWNKLETLIPEIDSRFILNSLGFEFVSIMINESDFSSPLELNNLLDKFCEKMEELIAPLF